MDEHREEREELAALDREQADDVREQEAARRYFDFSEFAGSPYVTDAAEERAYWQDVGLEPAERVTLETARWSR